ncbi:MAG: uroporphyrinogen-III C-methyltransferase [Rhodospirillaceae bacterium]|nr:MAG: uroporphyrinogen-III C-methyltransferase [Rhodospirillaceae bacterium]
MANVVELLNSRPSQTDAAVAKPIGAVVLVGAGPGDPELLTRKAQAAILAADIVFYDELVSAEIMAEIPTRIARVYVGKRHGTVSIDQADIIEGVITAVMAGKRVVRLKGGDPMIFGRGGEEIEALSAAGIEVSVVPGITAATGAASSTGIPLTHRDHAAQVTILTGTRRDGSLSDVRGLAGEGKTLIIYMAIRRTAEVAAALRADGVPGDLPVAIVENATRPNERTIKVTVDTLAETVVREAVQSPALLIVGHVAAVSSAIVRSTAAGEFGGIPSAHFATVRT